MTEKYRIVLPKLGESIVSATVVRWFKNVGDTVALDEPLLEVSTDKVNSEIPSPVAGVLEEICVLPENELEVGELLAVVRTGIRSESSENSISEHKEEVPPAQETRQNFLSPAVLRLAEESGICVSTLQTIRGTGAGGRVTKQDVEEFVRSRASVGSSVPCVRTMQESGEERVKMTGMRKTIADNLVKSFYSAPHATLIDEVDVTEIMKTVRVQKDSFFAKYGAKLTITSFFLYALGRALQEFPLLNSCLEQDTIVMKKSVNAGMAVNVGQGLIVPVVKNCHSLSLEDIAITVQMLSEKARKNGLAPDDVTEGTVTLTNFGMSGISIGIPIIRYPEVAILALGAIKKQVVVNEDDAIAIRSVCHMSLTFDHRIIDGMYGCAFLSSLKEHLKKDHFSKM